MIIQQLLMGATMTHVMPFYATGAVSMVPPNKIKIGLFASNVILLSFVPNAAL
jgi:hypothetical protein